MAEQLLQLAAVLILAGISLIVLALLAAALKRGEEPEAKTEAGGVILIGPVPIVFGTSQKIAAATMALAIILTALALLLFLASPK